MSFPELVAKLLRADEEKPEASFDNFAGMMEWLGREPTSTQSEASARDATDKDKSNV